MFGGKRRSEYNEQLDTIIGKESHFKGSITSKGSVRIDGQLEGEVVTAATVVIGETSTITAMIQAHDATIAGIVKGNVTIEDRLELLPTAKLYGDIKAGSLIVGEGAIFKGVCQMKQDSDKEKPQEK